MIRTHSIALLALFTLTSFVVAEEEMVVVKLSGGAQITATLLQKNDDRIVLDLGQEIITINAKRVLSIDSPEQQTDGKVKEKRFYTLGRLDDAPVSQLVKRYGDAVVTVSTPSGMGSGFLISKQGHLITNYHVIEKNLKITVTVFQQKAQGYEKRQMKKVKILGHKSIERSRTVKTRYGGTWRHGV